MKQNLFCTVFFLTDPTRGLSGVDGRGRGLGHAAADILV